MIGVLDHDSARKATRPGTTWANEMNFVMKHIPGAPVCAPAVQHYHCAAEPFGVTWFVYELGYICFNIFANRTLTTTP